MEAFEIGDPCPPAVQNWPTIVVKGIMVLEELVWILPMSFVELISIS
jgi:hypothetical protein